MTPEQCATLQQMLDDVETKYVEFVSPDTPIFHLSHFKSIETEILAYVDSLLAAKDAEIKRLQANQITPAMLSIWHAYQARIADDESVYPGEMSRFQAQLWAAFVAKMDGGE
jgi:hypothetical protein